MPRPTCFVSSFAPGAAQRAPLGVLREASAPGTLARSQRSQYAVASESPRRRSGPVREAAPSSPIVLAIRTPVVAPHSCIKRRHTLQRPSGGAHRRPRDTRTPTRSAHSTRAASDEASSLVAFRTTLWFSEADGQRVRPRLGRLAAPSPSDQQRTGTDAFCSRQAHCRLSRPRQGSTASARRPALASSTWTRSWGSSRGRRNHHITVPGRIRKWRTPTRPPQT